MKRLISLLLVFATLLSLAPVFAIAEEEAPEEPAAQAVSAEPAPKAEEAPAVKEAEPEEKPAEKAPEMPAAEAPEAEEPAPSKETEPEPAAEEAVPAAEPEAEEASEKAAPLSITVKELKDVRIEAGAAAFTVKAKTSDGSPLSYQWQALDASVNYEDDAEREAAWQDLKDETADILVFEKIDDFAAYADMRYRCRVFAGDTAVYTNEAKLLPEKQTASETEPEAEEALEPETATDEIPAVEEELPAEETEPAELPAETDAELSEENELGPDAEPVEDAEDVAEDELLAETEDPFAEEEPGELGAVTASGTCGTHLTWKLEDGILTVSGTGDMTDYSYGPAPWSTYKSDIRSIVIDSGVTSVSSSAFQDCTAASVVSFPDTLQTIDMDSFNGCTALQKVTIPASVSNIYGRAFYGCTSLKNVEILSTTVQIGPSTFTDCSNLKTAGPRGGGYNIEFSWTRTIPEHAFYECASLMSVTLPDTLTGIDKYAFIDCTALTKITFPASLTSIGEGVFQRCTSLNTISFLGNAPSIASDAFFRVKATAFYPSGNKTWTSAKRKGYGGTLSWAARTSTVIRVTYVLPQGVTTDNVREFDYMEDEPVLLRDAVCPGYTFLGWYTDSKCKNPIYELTSEIKKDIKLYPSLQANTYLVMFDKNAADAVLPSGKKMDPQPFTYGKKKALTANVFTRPGYTFAGWRDEYGVLYTNKQSVSNLTTEDGVCVLLSAEWKPIAYKITYKTEKDAYHQNPATYTVEDKTIPLLDAYRMGYAFDYWYVKGKNTDGKTVDIPITKIDCSKMAAMTIYPHWTANTYQVRFNANAFVDDTMPDQTFTYDSAQKLSANTIKRIGYTFTGWKTMSGSSTYKDKQSVKNLTSENGAVVMLYATWKAIDYKVKFVPNGGKVDFTLSMNFNALSDPFQIPPINLLSKPGYIFSGWYADKACTQRIRFNETDDLLGIYDVAKYAVNKVFTVYGGWSGRPYEIVFDKNASDATGTMDPQTATYNKDLVLIGNAYTRNGYFFNCWNTKPDGTGKKYTDKQTVKQNALYSGTGETRLYAQWTTDPYVEYLNKVNKIDTSRLTGVKQYYKLSSGNGICNLSSAAMCLNRLIAYKYNAYDKCTSIFDVLDILHSIRGKKFVINSYEETVKGDKSYVDVTGDCFFLGSKASPDTFKYPGYSASISFRQASNKKMSDLKKMLMEHPEGVMVMAGNHTILVTHFEMVNGKEVYYVLDPVNVRDGYIYKDGKRTGTKHNKNLPQLLTDSYEYNIKNKLNGTFTLMWFEY